MQLLDDNGAGFRKAAEADRIPPAPNRNTP